MRGPGRCVLRWGALPKERSLRCRVASHIMLHTAGLAKASYYICPIPPALEAQAAGHIQLQMAARRAQRASHDRSAAGLSMSQASGAPPSWALMPGELERRSGPAPFAAGMQTSLSNPVRHGTPEATWAAPRLVLAWLRRTRSDLGSLYAALSRRCLPASLRCTYDFRLAMGASSSSDITHATPSDTKYACAGAASSRHATDRRSADGSYRMWLNRARGARPSGVFVCERLRGGGRTRKCAGESRVAPCQAPLPQATSGVASARLHAAASPSARPHGPGEHGGTLVAGGRGPGAGRASQP
jgi:hypothetical protein